MTISNELHSVSANPEASNRHDPYFVDPGMIASPAPSYYVETAERLGPEMLKKMNRAVSKKIPEKEKKRLLRDHLELVKKATATGLTNKEEMQLRLIRWKLDRIEDAEQGEYLDRIEKIIEAQESLAKQIGSVVSQFDSKKTRPPFRSKSAR
jgi:hypothetical protein